MHFKMQAKKIIGLQAICRGNLTRKMYENMRIAAKVKMISLMFCKASSKYFTEDEAKETLHGFFK